MTDKAIPPEQDLDELRTKCRVLERKLMEIHTLYTVSRELAIPVKLDDLFDVSMKIMRTSLKVDDYCLLLLDPETETIIAHAAMGASEERELGPFDGRSGPLADILAKGEVHYVGDLKEGVEFSPYSNQREDIRSFLALPLKGTDGRAVGLLNFHSADPNAFSESDLQLFGGVAEHVGIAIDKAIAFQRTVELSNRDPLLNVYNRRYFFDVIEKEVSRAYRYNRPLSLIMLDIDHFKQFNDRNGHLKGDEALKALSGVLTESLRHSDLLARYGGEEFIILLPETEKESAITAAEKLRKQVSLTQFAGLPGEEGRLTITLGVSALSEEITTTYELVEFADKALYYGKALGRNRTCGDTPAPEGAAEDAEPQPEST